MTAIFFALLTSWFMLHPGHCTRVEVQWNAAEHSIEMAIRIDHVDLEAAMRKRLGRPVDVQQLSDEQAEQWIGQYLRETLRFGDGKLSAEQFAWVGWQRKRISSWVYVQLTPADNGAQSIALKILSLLEVEPELNHVVTIRHGGGHETVVLSKQQPVATVPTDE